MSSITPSSAPGTLHSPHVSGMRRLFWLRVVMPVFTVIGGCPKGPDYLPETTAWLGPASELGLVFGARLEPPRWC